MYITIKEVFISIQNEITPLWRMSDQKRPPNYYYSEWSKSVSEQK
jgi:hypothetical protein